MELRMFDVSRWLRATNGIWMDEGRPISTIFLKTSTVCSGQSAKHCQKKTPKFTGPNIDFIFCDVIIFRDFLTCCAWPALQHPKLQNWQIPHCCCRSFCSTGCTALNSTLWENMYILFGFAWPFSQHFPFNKYVGLIFAKTTKAQRMFLQCVNWAWQRSWFQSYRNVEKNSESPFFWMLVLHFAKPPFLYPKQVRKCSDHSSLLGATFTVGEATGKKNT